MAALFVVVNDFRRMRDRGPLCRIIIALSDDFFNDADLLATPNARGNFVANVNIFLLKNLIDNYEK